MRSLTFLAAVLLAGLPAHAQHKTATPVDRDTFRSSRLTLRFRRDPAGKVVGLDFTNPVLRNIAFARLTDCPDGR